MLPGEAIRNYYDIKTSNQTRDRVFFHKLLARLPELALHPETRHWHARLTL